MESSHAAQSIIKDLDVVSARVPTHWRVYDGDFRPATRADHTFASDSEHVWNGSASAMLRVRYPDPPDVANKRTSGIIQAAMAAPFTDKRIRFSAHLMTKGGTGALLCIRILDYLGTLADLQCKHVDGNHREMEWREEALIIDVPPESQTMLYGFVLTGQGYLWVDDVSLSVVDRDTPLTGKPIPLAQKTTGHFLLHELILAAPANLDFEATSEWTDDMIWDLRKQPAISLQDH